jgi:O-antigen/teichoic acid export membrane protein
MLAVRLISENDFGVFVLIQVTASFFGIIISFALENIAVTKLISGAEDDLQSTLANTAIYYKLIILITMSITILLCKPLILYIFKSEQLSQSVVYISLFFLVISLDDFFLRVLQGFHQYKKMAIAQIINGVTRIIFIVLFLILLKMNYVGLVYAFLLSFALSIVYQYLAMPFKAKYDLNTELFKKIFAFGFPLGLNNILNFIFTKIDRVMIGAMMSPVGVAYYEISSKIPENSRRIYQSFHSVFFPNMSELFSKNKYKDAETVLNNSIRFISLVTMFMAFISVLFQKDIICLLFTEKYIESAPAFAILMISLGIGLMSNIMGTSLVALGQSDKPVKINIVDTITNVAGNLIMIPLFGFIGAVYAALISRCATNPFNFYFLRKAGIKIAADQYLKPVIVFLLCATLFYFLPLNTLMLKILLIALFLILCWAISAIRTDDFSNLFQILKTQQVPYKKINQTEFIE